MKKFTLESYADETLHFLYVNSPKTYDIFEIASLAFEDTDFLNSATHMHLIIAELIQEGYIVEFPQINPDLAEGGFSKVYGISFKGAVFINSSRWPYANYPFRYQRFLKNVGFYWQFIAVILTGIGIFIGWVISILTSKC